MATPDREKLIRLTRQDITLYAEGKRAQLTPVGTLGKRAQFSVTGAQHVITNEGLGIDRKQARKEKGQMPLPQSEQTAWLLGHLVSPRHTNPTQLLVTSTAPETSIKVAGIIRDIFKLQPTSVTETQTKHGISTLRRYSSVDAVTRLGILTPDEFGKRALIDYPWLFNNPDLVWKFIEGLFDERGNIIKRDLRIYTTSQIFGGFVKDVLSHAGVPDIKEAYSMGKFHNIYTRSHEGLRLIAAKVHSSDPKKEEKLEELRNHEFKIKSPYEVLDIWKNISQGLGRPAQLSDIESGYRSKQFLWSPSLFKRFFGGSYSEANLQIKKLSMITADYFLSELPLPSSEALANAVQVLKSINSTNPGEIKPLGRAVIKFSESMMELKESQSYTPLLKQLTLSEREALKNLSMLSPTSEIFTGLTPERLTQKYSEITHEIQMELVYLKRKMEILEGN